MEGTPTGILRKTAAKRTISTAVRRSSLDQRGSPTSAVNGVHFQAPSNLQDLLVRAADKKKRDVKANAELEGLLTHIRNQRGLALVDWLQQIQQNISILKPRMEYFVLALLRISWADQDQPVVDAYRDFLVNLVTAQGYYTKPVVKMLICNLLGILNRAALMANTEGIDFDALEKQVFENTHETLRVILGITPLASKEALLKYAKEGMPYSLSPDTHSHTNYMTNLLKMTAYSGEKLFLMTLVIDRLVQLDAHLDKELLEDRDSDVSDDEFRKSPQLIAKANLDAGIRVFIQHVDQEDDIKKLYFDLIKIFETHILPAHTGHVQFILFYVLSKKPAFTAHFLDFLWTKFTCPNTHSVIRHATMSYIASLTSRAKFVSVSALMACLDKICNWIHSYINSSSTTRNTAMSGTALAAHGPFYAACQAVFYMFVFRHEELVASRKQLSFLRSLHFNTIVTSRLNPLYFCLFHVVHNFAAITRNYQLAYCETIIQRNSRISLPVVENAQKALSQKTDEKAATNNVLDAFFPFDPYRLPKSKSIFQPFYREYQGGSAEDDSSSSEDEVDGEEEQESDGNEIDDFLMEIEGMETPKPPKAKRRRTDSAVSNTSIDFAYGTSPGFKH